MLAADRFFLVMVLDDCIHVEGIPAWGPWDDTRLRFWHEPSLEPAGELKTIDRIRSFSELQAAITESVELGRPRTVWVHELLVDDVRTLWEDLLGLRASLKPKASETGSK